MGHQAFLRPRWLVAVAVLLTMAIAGSGAAATAALAHHHHASHHRRRHRRHKGGKRYKSVCYKKRHGHRRRVKCTTETTKGTTAHGNGASGTSATNQSNNWSGYNQGTLEQGGKLFNSIGARWTVPTATAHTKGQDEYSSDWIGIGGGCIDAGCTTTDSTLIQTGTEQDVSSSGQASYSAWWEVIPGPSLTITSMTIHPGDRMSAKIAEAVNDANVWTITINDLSRGESYSVTVPYSSSHLTAEWIEETPLVVSSNAGFAALPNLTSPKFDLATTNGAPAKLKSSEEMDLVDSNGKVIGAPSGPDPDTDGFNVCTWAASCSAPTSS